VVTLRVGAEPEAAELQGGELPERDVALNGRTEGRMSAREIMEAHAQDYRDS
jgi:hypothetical protein